MVPTCSYIVRIDDLDSLAVFIIESLLLAAIPLVLSLVMGVVSGLGVLAWGALGELLATLLVLCYLLLDLVLRGELVALEDLDHLVKALAGDHQDVLQAALCHVSALYFPNSIIVVLSLLCFLFFVHFNPFNSLLSVPFPLLYLTVWQDVHSDIFLLPFDPVSEVSPAISPNIHSIALLLVVLVMTMVDSTVEPLVGSLAVDHVVAPLSNVGLSIVPLVVALVVAEVAADLVVFPVTLEDVAVGPLVLSDSLLARLGVHTKVFTTVAPPFVSVSVLLVFFPLSFILGYDVESASGCVELFLLINSEAICLVMQEVSFIHVAISLHKKSLSFLLVFSEVPLVFRSIWEDQYTVSMLYSISLVILFDLALVDGSIIKDNFLFVFDTWFLYEELYSLKSASMIYF